MDQNNRNRENIKIGRFMSLILRHNPDAGGIKLDEHGWADSKAVIAAIKRKYPRFKMNMARLEEIVATNNKKRYSFNEDKTLIRANQGHSIPVDLEFKPAKPPDELYHGTATKSVPSIYKKGLLPMGRQFVHLSKDIQTAIQVGRRHGNPYIFKLNVEEMLKDGCKFYVSENGVWQTEYVAPKYLEAVEI